MGGSSKQTIGYWFNWAMCFGWCKGPVDAFLEFRAGDKTAWQGRLTSSGRISINKPNLWGGEDNTGGGSGGIVGDMDVMFGEADQVPNDYLISTFGPQQSARRGKFCTAFRGGKFGAFVANPKPVSALIERILADWQDSVVWYPEKATIPIAVAGSMPVGSSGWEYQQLPYEADPGHTNLTPPVSGWQTGGVGPFSDANLWTRTPDLSVFWIRKTVAISGIGLVIHAAADNGCVLFVNGQLIGTSNPDNLDIGGNEQYPVDYPVPSAGQYEIVVKAYSESTSPAQGGNYLAVSITADALNAMNPAHMLYDSLTHADMQGEPVGAISDESFRAAADKLYAEGFGLCTDYDSGQETPKQFQQRLCNVIGASLSQSRVDGLYYLDLIRGDYDLDSLPIIGEDDVISFSQDPSVITETGNKLSVEWFDPQAKETRTTAPVFAMGNVRSAGRVIPAETKKYPEIPIESLALRVAARDLKSTAVPLSKFDLSTKATQRGLRPGMNARLQLPSEGIADMVVVIGSVAHGTSTKGDMKIVAIQNVYSMPSTVYVTPQNGLWLPPDTIARPAPHQVAFEAPYVELATTLSNAELTALPADAGYIATAAGKPLGGRNYTISTAAAGESYADHDVFEWCPIATIVEWAAPLDTAFSVVGGQLLDRVALGSWALWDDEIVRVDVIDIDAGTITLGRGCADTVPAPEHLAGSTIYFCGDWIGTDKREYVGGDVVGARLLTNTPTEQLAPADATSLSVTVDERAARPYPPGDFRVAGEYWPTEQIFSAGVDITWAHRDRVSQADMLVDFGMASVGPEPGTTYTVENYNAATDVLLHSESGITDTTYTLSGGQLAYSNRVELYAVRDGLESWQRQIAEFTYGTQISGAVFGGVNQESYAAAFVVGGASAPIKWSLRGGALPTGIHVVQDGSDTVQLAGVPNAANGYYTTTLRAEDSNGLVAEKVIEIGIGTMASLLHFDGTAGQTTITDAVGKAWSRAGNASLATANPQFGTAAGTFDGTGDYWSTPHHADFIDAALTIRAWVRPASLTGSGVFRGIVSKRVSNSNATWTLYQGASNVGYVFDAYAGTSSPAISTLCGSATVNQYDYLTAGWQAGPTQGTVYGSMNGQSVAPVSGSSPKVLYAGSSSVVVGVLGSSQASSSQSFSGLIDEVAIIKGAVLYKENHPVQAAASDYPQTPAALAVSGSLPAGIAATAYSSTTAIVIHGSSTPFSVAVSDGALPGDWVAAVNADKVEVAGSGVVAGDYTFELAITDSASNIVHLPVTVRIA